MRLPINRAASLTLLVLILGHNAAPDPARRAPAPASPATQEARPAETYVPPDAPAGLENVVYLPLVLNNFDPTYVNPFGVIMYSGVNDSQGLPQMKAAGSRWVTARLTWSVIEPNPPVAGVHTYAWDSFDAQAHSAQVAGMNIFV